MKNKYENRFYRALSNACDLVYFDVKIAQSDLYIGADTNISDFAKKYLSEARAKIESEIAKNPAFLTSFYPLAYTGGGSDIVDAMYKASAACGVGPMAAVAGATASYVGERLCRHSQEVIVENGGDIFIKTNKVRHIAIYAGASALSHKLAIEVQSGTWGICTSAYTVGHSFSDGRCDAAIVISHDCALADSAATALGNSIKNTFQLKKGVRNIININHLIGAIAIINENIAVAGDIVIRPI